MTILIPLAVSAALIAIIKLIRFIQDEAQFEDKNVDEMCSHDWSPKESIKDEIEEL